MYICNCKGLRETQVRAVIDDGAHHVAHVFRACGEQPQCARCVRRIASMIRAHAPVVVHPKDVRTHAVSPSMAPVPAMGAVADADPSPRHLSA